MRVKLRESMAEAFGIKPFDPKTGEGLTAAMANVLWNDFTDFMQAQKKTGDVSPIASSPEPAST